MNERIGSGGNDYETVYALSPLPENIEEFAGQWTTIRNREVVVAAEDYDELINSPLFEPTDALYFVPRPGTKFYKAA